MRYVSTCKCGCSKFMFGEWLTNVAVNMKKKNTTLATNFNYCPHCGDDLREINTQEPPCVHQDCTETSAAEPS